MKSSSIFLSHQKDDPNFHNGAVLVLFAIIKHIMASASETELAALFYGCKEAIPLRTTLEELGYSQPGPTPVTTDNSRNDIGHGYYGPETGVWVRESNPGPTKRSCCKVKESNPGPTKKIVCKDWGSNPALTKKNVRAIVHAIAKYDRA